MIVRNGSFHQLTIESDQTYVDCSFYDVSIKNAVVTLRNCSGHDLEIDQGIVALENCSFHDARATDARALSIWSSSFHAVHVSGKTRVKWRKSTGKLSCGAGPIVFADQDLSLPKQAGGKEKRANEPDAALGV